MSQAISYAMMGVFSGCLEWTRSGNEEGFFHVVASSTAAQFADGVREGREAVVTMYQNYPIGIEFFGYLPWALTQHVLPALVDAPKGLPFRQHVQMWIWARVTFEFFCLFVALVSILIKVCFLLLE